MQIVCWKCSQVIGNQAGLTKALTNLVRLDFISLTTSCYNQSSVKTKGRLPLENLRFLMDSSFESINAKKGGVPQWTSPLKNGGYLHSNGKLP